MAITLQGWMKYMGGAVFNPDRGTQSAGPDRMGSSAGITVTDDVAMTVGAVFRCIRILSEVSALLPIVAYKRLPGGDREELEPNHWLSRLIRTPNPVMSGDQWAEAMYAQEAGWGNAYSQIVRNSEGRPVELWPYKVHQMKVERTEDLMVKYTYPDARGTMRELGKGRVAHMRGFTVDGVMGISPLGLARNACGIALQAETYAGSFFAHGGRPAGIMTSEKLLNQPQRDQIKGQYGSMADATTGERMWLLEGGLTYTPLTVNPDDMQLVLTRGFQVAEVARFFGVPLFLLFETEKSTSWGSGIEQQNNALKTYTLAPLAQDMENLWNHGIIPEAERDKIFVAVDLEALQTADLAAMLAFYGGATDKAIMTSNEARRKLKLPRSTDKNADRLRTQSAQVPLEKLGETPPVPPRQAPGEPAGKEIHEAPLPVIIDMTELRGAVTRVNGTMEALASTIDHAAIESTRRIRHVERALEEVGDRLDDRPPPPPAIRTMNLIRGADNKLQGLEYVYEDETTERFAIKRPADGNVEIVKEIDNGD